MPMESSAEWGLYEHTVIARPDLSAQQAQALADAFTEIAEGHGGEVSKVEYWGLRNLSYRIKKNRKGHYLHLNITGPSAAVMELERTQRIHEDVLRYLTVRSTSSTRTRRPCYAGQGQSRRARPARSLRHSGLSQDEHAQRAAARVGSRRPGARRARPVAAVVGSRRTSPFAGRSFAAARAARSPSPTPRRSTTRT